MSRSNNRLAKIHKDLCRELGIHPARIIFVDDDQVFGNYTSHTQIIRINPDKVRGWSEFAMAHETYHHYQTVKGWLTNDEWRGRSKALLKYMFEWKKRPWEVGANRYANKQRKLKGWP